MSITYMYMHWCNSTWWCYCYIHYTQRYNFLYTTGTLIDVENFRLQLYVFLLSIRTIYTKFRFSTQKWTLINRNILQRLFYAFFYLYVRIIYTKFQLFTQNRVFHISTYESKFLIQIRNMCSKIQWSSFSEGLISVSQKQWIVSSLFDFQDK